MSYTNLTNISSGAITDKLPAGVTYQKGSLQLADPDNNWQYQPIDDTKFVQQSTVSFPYTIPAGGGFNLKLKATVDQTAADGQVIVNQAQAGDSSKTVNSNAANINVKANYVGHFDKLVLNQTNQEKTFQKTTTGQAGDELRYQLQYTVADNSGTSLKTGNLVDQLPTGLKFVPNSIEIVYSDGTKETAASLDQIKLKTLTKGQSATVTFKATIEQLEAGALKNVATFSGQDGYDHTLASETSDATVNVQKVQPSHVYLRYVDRSTQQVIPSAMAGQAQWLDISGAVGQKVSEISPGEQLTPKTLADWTPVSQVIRDDAAPPAAAAQPANQKSDPLIANHAQYYTYYYEPTAISISAPDKWQFGEFSATSKNTHYYLTGQKDAQNKSQPYQVKVNDYYGMADWHLNVAQTSQFQTTGVDHQPIYELTDAQLQFTNLSAARIAGKGNSEEQPSGQLTSMNNVTLAKDGHGQVNDLMTYTKTGHYANHEHLTNDHIGTTYDNPGWGVYALQFGNQEQADYSIALKIPQTTTKHKAFYKTKLTWTLSTGPQ